MNSFQDCLEKDKKIKAVYDQCIAHLEMDRRLKLMCITFFFNKGGWALEYYLFPLEKSLFKRDLAELSKIDIDMPLPTNKHEKKEYERKMEHAIQNSEYFVYKHTIELVKKITSKEELDHVFDDYVITKYCF
jgi:hypothetical protein